MPYQCISIYFHLRDREVESGWDFEYSNERLAHVIAEKDRSGPLGWSAQHITIKANRFVGVDENFYYARYKAILRHFEISVTVSVSIVNVPQGPFSEVSLSHWFDFMDFAIDRLSLLTSQEIVETTFMNETKIKIGDGMRNTKKVFVVHGRNKSLRNAMFSFLRAIQLEPLEWNQVVLATGRGTPSISEIIEKGFSMAQAAVVLFTGDDEARLRDEFHTDHELEQETKLFPQPRANVLYEAGMAMGRYPDRTILVKIGQVKLFSDISGFFTVHLDNSMEKRQDLAYRLKNAGCIVNMSGIDWHNEGDFNG